MKMKKKPGFPASPTARPAHRDALEDAPGRGGPHVFGVAVAHDGGLLAAAIAHQVVHVALPAGHLRLRTAAGRDGTGTGTEEQQRQRRQRRRRGGRRDARGRGAEAGGWMDGGGAARAAALCAGTERPPPCPGRAATGGRADGRRGATGGREQRVPGGSRTRGRLPDRAPSPFSGRCKTRRALLFVGGGAAASVLPGIPLPASPGPRPGNYYHPATLGPATRGIQAPGFLGEDREGFVGPHCVALHCGPVACQCPYSNLGGPWESRVESPNEWCVEAVVAFFLGE